MALSLHTDFALRSLIYLAGKARRASAAEIASFYGISKDHVAKVVQDLAKRGYIRSVRGMGGGVELTRAATEINLGEVILSIEGKLQLLECVKTDNVCVIQLGCKLRRVLAEAERIQLEYLRGIRLSDVVEPGQQLVDLGVPPPRDTQTQAVPVGSPSNLSQGK